MLLETRYEPRIWGGFRLGDGREPVGEGWGAYEGNRIASGPLRGMALASACQQFGEQILGEAASRRFGNRFPILTKLLDTHDWLSVQVHPNDEQAIELEGQGYAGKTEAWHLLETEPDAGIILGLQPGIDAETFSAAVRSQRTLDVIARQNAVAGDTWFIPAGTVHALGPGIFLYEVQQSSDITYRVYDWDRPASAGRDLHLDQAISCVEPGSGERIGPSPAVPGTVVRLVECPYFQLDRLVLAPGSPTTLDTGRQSFHAITVAGGPAEIVSSTGKRVVENYETAIVPASAGQYAVASGNPVTLLISSVPQS